MTLPFTIHILIGPGPDGTYTLEVGYRSLGDDGPVLAETVKLQSGYKSPTQALEAFIQALTIAPPDLKVYDEAMAMIPQLVDQARDQQEIIDKLQETVKEMEEALMALASPARSGNRFLQGIGGGIVGGRQHGDPAPHREQPESSSPPPLRRAVSMGQATRAGEITAGPIRGRGSVGDGGEE